MTATRTKLPYKSYDGTLANIDAVLNPDGLGGSITRPVHTIADINGAIVDFATDASSQQIVQGIGYDGTTPPTLPGGSSGIRGWLRAILAALTGTLTVSDTQNRAFYDHVSIVPGAVAVPPGRTIEVNCTTAGNVALKLSSGREHIVPVVTGYSSFPFEVIGVNTGNTTAVATYFNLY